MAETRTSLRRKKYKDLEAWIVGEGGVLRGVETKAELVEIAFELLEAPQKSPATKRKKPAARAPTAARRSSAAKSPAKKRKTKAPAPVKRTASAARKRRQATTLPAVLAEKPYKELQEWVEFYDGQLPAITLTLSELRALALDVYRALTPEELEAAGQTKRKGSWHTAAADHRPSPQKRARPNARGRRREEKVEDDSSGAEPDSSDWEALKRGALQSDSGSESEASESEDITMAELLDYERKHVAQEQPSPPVQPRRGGGRRGAASAKRAASRARGLAEYEDQYERRARWSRPAAGAELSASSSSASEQTSSSEREEEEEEEEESSEYESKHQQRRRGRPGADRRRYRSPAKKQKKKKKKRGDKKPSLTDIVGEPFMVIVFVVPLVLFAIYLWVMAGWCTQGDSAIEAYVTQGERTTHVITGKDLPKIGWCASQWVIRTQQLRHSLGW